MDGRCYLLWCTKGQSTEALRDSLLTALRDQGAIASNTQNVRLAVVDCDVAPAAARRMECHTPLPDALVSCSLGPSMSPQALEVLIDKVVGQSAAYAVEQREPLVSAKHHPVQPGGRVFGMCQVALLRRPESIEMDHWLTIWRESHTQVAIDTQSTFGYRQNRVLRPLGEGQLPVDAIVTENFPPEAMTDDHAFYGTGGDETLLAQNMTRLLESCARFIDFEHIDVIPMSEYRIT